MSDVEEDELGKPWGLLAFLVALLAFDFFMPLVYPLADPLPDVIEFAYVGFLLAQVGLHAALVVLWQDCLRVRMASIPLVTVLAMLHLSQGVLVLQQSIHIVVIMWVLVAVVMLGVGVMGWELQRWPPWQLESANPSQPQISLLGLGVLVTVACIMAAVSIEIDWGSATSAELFLPVVFAIQAVVVFAGVLMPRQMMWLTMLSLAIAWSVGGFWVFIVFQANIYLRPAMLITLILPTILQTLFLIAMRRLGYRLWRLAPSAREMALGRDAQT